MLEERIEVLASWFNELRLARVAPIHVSTSTSMARSKNHEDPQFAGLVDSHARLFQGIKRTIPTVITKDHLHQSFSPAMEYMDPTKGIIPKGSNWSDHLKYTPSF